MQKIKKTMKFSDIIGKEILATKILDNEYYIFFSDRETFISLYEQDYHDYHDASVTAREISIQRDKNMWEKAFKFSKNSDHTFY